jgi:hypothetical protein
LFNLRDETDYAYQPAIVLVTNSKRWFNGVEEVAFDKLWLRYKHLVAWAGASTIRALSPQDFQPTGRGSQLFSFQRPFVLQTVNVGHYFVSLWVSYHVMSGTDGSAPSLTFANDTFFSVKPRQGKITLEGAKDIIRIIMNFLSLMIGESTFNDSIEGFIDVSDAQRLTRIKVFPSVHVPKNVQAANQADMLFPYQELAGLFKQAFRAMFVKEMQPLYNQFFAEQYQPSAYEEDRFMAAIRAIEVFHRRVRGGSYVDETEYKKCKQKFSALVETLVQNCDFKTLENEAAFKNSLKQRLTYGYQYSLNKRLQDILADQTVFLQLFVNENLDGVLNWYANKIAKTRHYYTHYDDEDKNEAITGAKELKLAAERLIVLLYMLLLHYVGVPKEAVDVAMQRHSETTYNKFGYLRAKTN